MIKLQETARNSPGPPPILWHNEQLLVAAILKLRDTSSFVLKLFLTSVSCLVIFRALKLAGFATPHTQLLSLRFCFRLRVDLLQSAIFSAFLAFIDRCQPSLDHLQAYIAPDEPAPDEDRPHDSLVLISPIYKCPHVPVQNVVGEPLGRFGRKGLGWAAEMGALGSIDAGNSDRNLQGE